MRNLRYLLLACLFAVPALAKADTLDFTITLTQQNGISLYPVGTVFTGSAHYAGTWPLNSTSYPPAIDAFHFDYPSTPSSPADYWMYTVQRFHVGAPQYLLVTYLDPSDFGASFSITGPLFTILTPIGITPNSFGYSKYESGTVTYTVVPDPVATTPPSRTPSLCSEQVWPASGLFFAAAPLPSMARCRRSRPRLTLPVVSVTQDTGKDVPLRASGPSR